MKNSIFIFVVALALLLPATVFAISFENPTMMHSVPDPHGVAVNRTEGLCTDIVDLQLAYNGEGWEGGLGGVKLPKGWEALRETGSKYLLKTPEGSCTAGWASTSSLDGTQNCCEEQLHLTYTPTPSSDRILATTQRDNVEVCKVKNNSASYVFLEDEPDYDRAACERIFTDDVTITSRCIDIPSGVVTSKERCSEGMTGIGKSTSFFFASSGETVITGRAYGFPTLESDCPLYSSVVGDYTEPFETSEHVRQIASFVFDEEKYCEYDGDAKACCGELGYSYLSGEAATTKREIPVGVLTDEETKQCKIHTRTAGSAASEPETGWDYQEFVHHWAIETPHGSCYLPTPFKGDEEVACCTQLGLQPVRGEKKKEVNTFEQTLRICENGLPETFVDAIANNLAYPEKDRVCDQPQSVDATIHHYCEYTPTKLVLNEEEKTCAFSYFPLEFKQTIEYEGAAERPYRSGIPTKNPCTEYSPIRGDSYEHNRQENIGLLTPQGFCNADETGDQQCCSMLGYAQTAQESSTSSSSDTSTTPLFEANIQKYFPWVLGTLFALCAGFLVFALKGSHKNAAFIITGVLIFLAPLLVLSITRLRQEGTETQQDLTNTVSEVTINSASSEENANSSISEVRKRDEKRISDIRQIQAALELYYNDQASPAYPYSQAENAILDSTLLPAQYLAVVPSAPEAPDGPCAQLDGYEYTALTNRLGATCTNSGNQSCGWYILTFCLEEPIGGLDAGIQVASPLGIGSI